MIAKILPKNRIFSAIIEYNLKDDSTLLSIENFPFQDVKMLEKHFNYYSQLSTIKEQVFHVALNFPLDERILSKEEIQEIAKDYMEQMGYGDQVYGTFLHTDKSHIHLHIVASRVDELTRKKINDSFEFKKSQTISTNIEQKYNLKEVPRTKQNTYQKAENISTIIEYLNTNIETVFNTNTVNSIKELGYILAKNNIETRILEGKKGVVFYIVKEGMRERGIASSKIPFFQEKSLRSRIYANKRHKEYDRIILKPIINNILQTVKTTDELSKRLLEKGIQTHYHKRSDNTIYGLSFEYKQCIYKASDIDRKYSWKNIETTLLKNSQAILPMIETETTEPTVVVPVISSTSVNIEPNNLISGRMGSGYSGSNDDDDDDDDDKRKKLKKPKFRI